MSLNSDQVEERLRGARAAVWRMAGPWALLLLLWVGFFALFRGISEIVVAFELRSRQRA